MLKTRDHVFYPGIRTNNNNDQFSVYKHIHPQKDSSFPPISQDNQKQNNVIQYLYYDNCT